MAEPATKRLPSRGHRTDRLGSAISIATPVGSAATAVIAGNPWAAPVAVPIVALVLWRTVRKRVDPAQLGLPLAYAAVASKVFE